MQKTSLQRSLDQKPAKARHWAQSRQLARAHRQHLPASCTPTPSSHRLRKQLVTSCSWGSQRHLSSQYLFNSGLEKKHHSEVRVQFGLAHGNVCGMCRTSRGLIASQEKWLVELGIMESFHILINRLNNKTLRFILASFFSEKKMSHTLLSGLVVKSL